MIAYEHLQQGVMNLRHLCRYDFEVACFGHGPPIRQAAASKFRERWEPAGRSGGKQVTSPRSPGGPPLRTHPLSFRWP